MFNGNLNQRRIASLVDNSLPGLIHILHLPAHTLVTFPLRYPSRSKVELNIGLDATSEKILITDRSLAYWDSERLGKPQDVELFEKHARRIADEDGISFLVTEFSVTASRDTLTAAMIAVANASARTAWLVDMMRGE